MLNNTAALISQNDRLARENRDRRPPVAERLALTAESAIRTTLVCCNGYAPTFQAIVTSRLQNSVDEQSLPPPWQQALSGSVFCREAWAMVAFPRGSVLIPNDTPSHASANSSHSAILLPLNQVCPMRNTRRPFQQVRLGIMRLIRT